MTTENLDRIYTKSAIEYQRNMLYGNASIIRPFGAQLYIVVVSVILLAAGIFLYFGEFPRKVVVLGYLVPESGMTRIYPTGPGGTITNVFVKENELVNIGDKLVEISYESRTTSGILPQNLLLIEANRQLESLEEQRKNISKKYDLEREMFTSRLQQLSSEIHVQEQRKNLQEETLKIAARQISGIERLYTDELISESQYLLSKSEQIEQQKLLLTIDQAISELLSQRSIVEDELLRAGALEAIEEAQLTFQISQVQIKITEISSRYSELVISPSPGSISNMQVRVGEVISTNRPLMSLLPNDNEIVAKILIPSSAIGFIEPGMSLNLMLDSFPYQEYGTIRSKLVSVSQSPIAPDEIDVLVKPNVPVYVGEAQVEANSIAARGTSQRLLPGMTFKADVVLEERSLIRWILEPFYNLRGRT